MLIVISERYFNKFICYSWSLLEVIIDEFVKAGLVLEKDAEQKLKVWYISLFFSLFPFVLSYWFLNFHK